MPNSTELEVHDRNVPWTEKTWILLRAMAAKSAARGRYPASQEKSTIQIGLVLVQVGPDPMVRQGHAGHPIQAVGVTAVASWQLVVVVEVVVVVVVNVVVVNGL